MLMHNFKFKALRYRKRWFCYLDLLGFTTFVKDNNIGSVINIYHEVLTKLSKNANVVPTNRITYSWFSDTFIIYSRSDSEKEFAVIEGVGRRFFQDLVLNGIPVRGAITHGGLYSQSSKNIFVGPALIEAYLYAESQNWLGFVLTPSVFGRLKDSSIPLHERAHYRELVDPTFMKSMLPGPLYAFAFNNSTLNGHNPYVTALQKMMALAPDKDKLKYDNSIAFANKYWRRHGH
jgi:hypothetical protein